MTPNALLEVLSLACAALIGFAAHRASLCNVRAVAELMSGGSTHMLWSLLQAVLWMAALTGVLALVFGLAPRPVLGRAPWFWAVAGGAVFGIGAAVNGGCSLSTLTRLADGNTGMMISLAGFALGVGSFLGLGAAGLHLAVEPLPSPWLSWPRLAPWLLSLLLAWAVHRIGSVWRLTRAASASGASLFLAPSYHLSVAAALMGLAAGLLYATQGAWSYSNYLRTEVLHVLGGDMPAPSVWHTALMVALMGGMLASSRQRRTLVWSWPGTWRERVRYAVGGALMGVGAALVPGGNDTVLLGGLPTLTVTAGATYLSMLLGIALVLWMMRMARVPMPALACTPSGCEEVRTP